MSRQSKIKDTVVDGIERKTEAMQSMFDEQAVAAERQIACEQARSAYTMVLDSLEAPTIAILANLQAVMGGWFTEQQGFAKMDFPMDVALMHSELSEALEADRKQLKDDHIPEFDGRAAELADLLVRVFHAADKYDLDLGPAFFAKMKVNLQRPFKHGKEY